MGILNAAVTCRTSLLPNTIKDRDQVGNWQPITIGNLLMRIYGRTLQINGRRKELTK